MLRDHTLEWYMILVVNIPPGKIRTIIDIKNLLINDL
jgi:hypothetical protein